MLQLALLLSSIMLAGWATCGAACAVCAMLIKLFLWGPMQISASPRSVPCTMIIRHVLLFRTGESPPVIVFHLVASACWGGLHKITIIIKTLSSSWWGRYVQGGLHMSKVNQVHSLKSCWSYQSHMLTIKRQELWRGDWQTILLPSHHVDPSCEMSPFPVASLFAPVNVDINRYCSCVGRSELCLAQGMADLNKYIISVQ